jgi:small-conductance mechanosensitive channel
MVKNANLRFNLKQSRGYRIQKVLKIGTYLLFFLSLLIIWGFKPDNIWIVGSAVLSFIGIGLFASWSFFSNILASFILFFTSPYKIGDTISFKEGSEDFKGKITDMTTIFVYVTNDEGGEISIPNNQLLQRVVLKHPRKPLRPDESISSPQLSKTEVYE